MTMMIMTEILPLHCLCVCLCVSVWLCLSVCVFMCGASAKKVNAWICAPAVASDLESASRKSVRT